MSKKFTVDEMKRYIISILPENTYIEEFSYNAECFGNIVVHIKKCGKSHTFKTDRGEIYHNDTMLCDSSYHYKEKEDTFSKLLQMISKEMDK